MAIEPVQGEGNPGQCVSEFYDAARRLTLENDSMLLVDSIQAGIRGKAPCRWLITKGSRIVRHLILKRGRKP